MYDVGLDLHKKYVTGCVMDSHGVVMAQERRLPPVLEILLGWLAPLGQPVAVAVEATLYWAWLHDRLTAAGYQVVVAHATQVKLICHARCKTDAVDARKLADLLRTDLLPTIWIPDAETRGRRTLLRGRAWVVRTRTRVKARIQAYLAAENERVPVSDLFSRGGRAWLVTVALPPAVRQQVDRLLALVAQLDVAIAEQDRAVRELARATPEAERLQTIPGIGPFGALLLLAEIGTIARFGSSHELAAYAGLVPSTRSSGGKTAHRSEEHTSELQSLAYLVCRLLLEKKKTRIHS